jgi:hypothetical protein
MFDSNRIENAMQMNQSDLYAAAVAARDAGESAQMGRASGCGRVYVFVGYKPLRRNSKAAKTLQSAGFRLTPRPSDSGVLIYVGYDNATGCEIGMGEAIAQSFRDSGIAAGLMADGD